MSEPERKKRRQNVACDPCRLRRVKCDIAALLDTGSDSTLATLVQENPHVSCSNCTVKGIRCTTAQIVNPPRPNKGGKRIDEARRAFGSPAEPSPMPQLGLDLLADPFASIFGLAETTPTPSGPSTGTQSACPSAGAWPVEHWSVPSALDTSDFGLWPQFGPTTPNAFGQVVPLASLTVGRKRRLSDDDPWDALAGGIQFCRRERVGDELAERAIGIELSRHLIHTYFHSVHFTLPTISPEAFFAEWQRAGERADRMAPDQEALCAVLEAWAARYSDHPAILGVAREQSHTAPKVITGNGMFVPGATHRSKWGKARLKACQGLLRRARHVIDLHQITTKPTVTGVQALCMYSQLTQMSDLDHNHEKAMEHHMMHTILVEQLHMLDLNWAASAAAFDNDEDALLSVSMSRVKQRRLFWTIVVSDSFWAAASGREPKLSDEEVEASGEWLVTIEEALQPSTFKALSFIMGGYHRCAVIARQIARKMSIPMKRPGTVDVNEFCNRTRAIWRDIRNLHKDVNERMPEILDNSDRDLLGFSPIHHFTSIRNSCSFLLLVMHQNIEALREFRRGLREAYVHSPSSQASEQPENDRAKRLEELFLQSMDVTLSFIRTQAGLFEKLLPTGFLQGGSVLLRMLLSSAQFLVEVPTNEQGYPSNTLGGAGWTWETKQREVALFVEALHQLGWAWSDASDVIDAVAATMERMTPTPDELAAYVPQPSTYIARRDDELAADSKTLDSVLRFWPPTSIPKAINQWSRSRIVSGVFFNLSDMGQESSTPEIEHRSMLDSWSINANTAALPSSSGQTLSGEATPNVPTAGSFNPADSINLPDPAGVSELGSELETFLQQLISGDMQL